MPSARAIWADCSAARERQRGEVRHVGDGRQLEEQYRHHELDMDAFDARQRAIQPSSCRLSLQFRA